MTISIQLKHGPQKYTLDVSPIMTVGELKETVAELTGVPTEVQKLIVDSHVLRKDSRTLQEENLKKKCKIVLVGHRGPPPPSREKQQTSSENTDMDGEGAAQSHPCDGKSIESKDDSDSKRRKQMEIFALKLSPAQSAEELQAVMQRIGDYAAGISKDMDALEQKGAIGDPDVKFLRESREVLTNKILMLDSLTSDKVTPPILVSKRSLLKSLIATCDRIDGLLKCKS